MIHRKVTRRCEGVDLVGIVTTSPRPSRGFPLPPAPNSSPRGAVVAKDRVDRYEEDLVRLYLSDIGQYTLLTKDDEVRLAKLIESGKSAIADLDSAGKDITAARKREL